MRADVRRQKEILRITLVNREWERTLGWSLDELQTRDLHVFAECYPDPQYRERRAAPDRAGGPLAR
jgi:PAS domain-containing protein